MIQEKNEHMKMQPNRLSPIKELEHLYQESIGGDIDPTELVLKQTPDHSTSDFGIPMFTLAKTLRQNPTQIAEKVAQDINHSGHRWIKMAHADGPYTNIELDMNRFGRDIISKVLVEGPEYGKENIGQGKRVVIDMSSPNIAKQMSIAHLRSTIIGDALAKIYRATGHEVVRDNHIGDWGTQFGKIIEAVKRWGNEEEIFNSDNPVEELQALYKRFHDEAKAQTEASKKEIRTRIKSGEVVEEYTNEVEKQTEAVMRRKHINRDEVDMEKVSEDALEAIAVSELEDNSREWFKKLEEGDPEARRLWKLCVDLSLREFEKVYDVLGVEFEEVLGESFYEPMLQDIIEEVRSSGTGTISDGALVVDLEDAKLGTPIVQKSDGTSLYMTRDLAAAEYRQNEMNADAQIYVVGGEQKFYFQQLFEVLRRLGHPIGENSTHIYFGLVTLPEGKMSTRSGRVILLKDVINEGVSRADKLLVGREEFSDPNLRADTARKVAVGALKWNDLYQGAGRNIIFDWDTALNFDGESGPYVQYAAVRANTILDKFGIDIKGAKELKVEESEEIYQSVAERELVKALAQYSSALTEAQKTNGPNKITEYVYKVAKLYSQFYRDVSVLRAETETQRNARLRLCAATAQVITNSLNLLGIEVPQQM